MFQLRIHVFVCIGGIFAVWLAFKEKGNYVLPVQYDTQIEQHRTLQQEYKYVITDPSILGEIDVDVTIGNPLKGLLSSPDWTGPTTPNVLPSSLEFYYVGLDEVMIGYNEFNWNVLDMTLRDAAKRYKHVIWRVYCHYPGRKLAIPQYLIDQNIPIIDDSPQYDDPVLLEAFKQFIIALGNRYDGHKSLAFIQLGLLGYWGEWHTYPDKNLLSDTTKTKVLNWYTKAFKVTKLQVRDPTDAYNRDDVGFHDDSFGYSTLGTKQWYFWPKVVESKNIENWKENVMGGETRPELQSKIFEAGYEPDSDENRQLFMECVRTCHATYMLHSNAFHGGGYSGIELRNAKFAHTRMGYNFAVTKVTSESMFNGNVVVSVTLRQLGVAPFYYPLSLVLSCATTKMRAEGVELLIEPNDLKTFRFENVEIDPKCFKRLNITLYSNFTYNERPIKFAQGIGIVSFSLPLPDEFEPIPPTFTPTSTPTRLPIAKPVPTRLPIARPTSPQSQINTTLNLVDIYTGSVITEMTNGMIIDLMILKNISIVAFPPQSFVTGSVQFKYDDRIIRTENSPPFTVGGNSGADIFPWVPSVGKHTIMATPFRENNANGDSGNPCIIQFIVTRPSTILTLINADTDTDVGTLTNDTVIDRSVLPNINIRIDPDFSVSTESAQFVYDGRLVQMEYQLPYVLKGSSGSNYYAWQPEVGHHTIIATTFSDKAGRLKVDSVAVSFSVV